MKWYTFTDEVLGDDVCAIPNGVHVPDPTRGIYVQKLGGSRFGYWSDETARLLTFRERILGKTLR